MERLLASFPGALTERHHRHFLRKSSARAVQKVNPSTVAKHTNGLQETAPLPVCLPRTLEAHRPCLLPLRAEHSFFSLRAEPGPATGRRGSAPICVRGYATYARCLRLEGRFGSGSRQRGALRRGASHIGRA